MEKKKEPSMTVNRPPPKKRIKAASGPIEGPEMKESSFVEPPPMAVIIKDIQIPFWSMVTLTVKWAFALIPAGLATAFIWKLIVQFFGVMGYVL